MFVAALSLKSTITFVISAALHGDDKNNPPMFRGQRGDAILSCTPTLAKNVCCIDE